MQGDWTVTCIRHVGGGLTGKCHLASVVQAYEIQASRKALTVKTKLAIAANASGLVLPMQTRQPTDDEQKAQSVSPPAAQSNLAGQH